MQIKFLTLKCLFKKKIIQYEKNLNVCCCVSLSVVSKSLQLYELYLPGPLCPWNSPGKNTGVGCHFLLQ